MTCANAAIPTRWSLNSITVPYLELPELLESATKHGYQGIGLWRDHFDDYAAAEVAARVAESGLRVSSLCRAGLFTHEDPAQRARAIDDSLLAVDQAAALRAAAVVVVPGGLVARDLVGSRSMVRDGLGRLAEYAASRGVSLALEPMHPMLVEARSCITTVGEALDVLDELGMHEHGIALDSYHVWWDAGIDNLTDRLKGRIHCVQIADWIDPDNGPTTSRGIPGEGCIDFGAFLSLAARLQYTGDIEVEVLSERWWERGARKTLQSLDAALTALHPAAGPWTGQHSASGAH
ncbi:MAG: sugar phosphate isomerase/epimerase family protein [Nocardioides sp.]|uniref:sugar phosphate isomerase/epimerase family protein n=1 Tax=Nocardioides sp. TaxID=35761 RepID=UPI0039E3EF91